MGSDVVGMLHMVKYIFSTVFYFLFVYICSFSFYFILFYISLVREIIREMAMN